MKRTAYILSGLMVILTILNGSMCVNRALRIAVQSHFQRSIREVGSGDFGTIYKTGIQYLPQDSIIEYTWNGHMINRGHIRRLGRTTDEMRKDFDGSFRKTFGYACLIQINGDTIYVYQGKLDRLLPATIFINYHNLDAVYIYRDNYQIDDAIAAGIFIMTGVKGSYVKSKYNI